MIVQAMCLCLISEISEYVIMYSVINIDKPCGYDCTM